MLAITRGKTWQHTHPLLILTQRLLITIHEHKTCLLSVIPLLTVYHLWLTLNMQIPQDPTVPSVEKTHLGLRVSVLATLALRKELNGVHTLGRIC